MKRFLSILGLASLLIFSVQPVWARCTPLINEGREFLSKTNLPADQAGKIKRLLDEAQKFRDSGDHTNGFKKASEALDLLKKR